MDIINLCDQNSLVGQFMSEIRNKDLQQERLRFRANIQRLGQIMAYEISKRLIYNTVGVTTPLGVKQCNVLADRVVLATLLRAGLPFHEGFLNFFDGAENAFVSAYRKYLNDHDDFVVHIEYIASPRLDGKTLVIVDPMLATGGSMAASIEALVKTGKPKKIHIACVIAVPEGIETIKSVLPDDSTIWCAAIDPGMNEHKYIVPGFGDCGDLCYGEKL